MVKTNLPNNQSTIKTCSLADCPKPVKAKGFCNKHYSRLLRYGTLKLQKQIVDYKGDSFEETFWERVDKFSSTGNCWEWIATKNHDGYGQVRFKGKKYAAHRMSWMLAYGNLPEKCLLHSCDNPSCVNPEHLREGSNADNAKDRSERSRTAKGSKHGMSKLDEAQVRQIKILLEAGFAQKKIAQRFKVTSAAISYIHIGKTWRHVQ